MNLSTRRLLFMLTSKSLVDDISRILDPALGERVARAIIFCRLVRLDVCKEWCVARMPGLLHSEETKNASPAEMARILLLECD